MGADLIENIEKDLATAIMATANQLPAAKGVDK
jgi:hypothetical protein